MRRAKILATLGPASESLETIRRLIRAGVDGFRVNLAHGEADWHREAAERVRCAASELGRPVGFLMDLAGPKIRTGLLRDGGPVFLEKGSEVRIVEEEMAGDAAAFSTTLRGWIDNVPDGSRLLLDDGTIELRSIGREPGALRAVVVVPGALGEHKGINLPGVRLSMPSLTPADLAHIELGREIGTDLFALSFVRSADDVREARARIEASGRPAPLVAKIEKAEAIDVLDEIIEEADGVLVARGDLGVEMATEEVPVLQKRIIRGANAAGKFVITATQMLQSMVTQTRPTRAEASDVANAVFDGSDALLLTGETTIGRHPVETVETMDRIVRRAEESAYAESELRDRVPGAAGSYRRAIAEAAAFAAIEMRARMIIVFTLTGTMARHLAALRPRQRIVALTPSEETRRRLAFVWGVEPYRVEFDVTSDGLLRRSAEFLVRNGIAAPGEEVIAMAGKLADVEMSRMMMILRLDEAGASG